MDLKKLTVTLEVNTGAYKNALRAARQETEKSAEVARSASNSIKKSMSSVSIKGFMSGIKGRIKDYQLKAGIKVPTKEYEEITAELENAEAALNRYYTRKEKLESIGTDKESKTWKGLQYDIRNAEKEVEKYKSAKQRMEEKGTDTKKVPTKEYEEITAELKKAEAALERYCDKKEKLEYIGSKKESKAWKGLQLDIYRAEGQVKRYEAIKRRMEEKGTATKKVPTKEYEKITADLKNAEAALNRYCTKKEKLESMGTEKESQAWKKLQYDICNAEETVKRYESAKRRMEAAGTDVQRPVSLPKQALNFGRSALKGIASIPAKGWGGMTKLLGGMHATLSKVTAAIKRTSGAFGALIQKFATGIPFLKRAKSSFNGFGTSGQGLVGILKTIGMTAKFMFASFLIRGVITGMKQGMQNLAKYSEKTNASLSLLKSSLTQLKNSMATAFAPVLDVIAPILDSFIQMLIRALNAVGQFFGALTGKSVIVRAKKVNQDYAASLSGTSDNLKENASSADKASDAAEKYKRTLLGFDQINKLDDTSSSGSTGGESKGASLGGINDMFETTSIKSQFKDLAKLIKESWANADFTELGAIIGRKLNTALERIPWEQIQSTCNRIAQSVATLLNGFLETTNWGLVGNTIAQGINTAFGMANTFAESFHWGSLGTAVGNGINGALNGLDWETIQGTVHNVVSGLIESLNSFLHTADWNKIGQTISQYFNTKLEAFHTAVSEFEWDTLGISISDGINGAVSAFDFAKAGEATSNVIKGVLDAFIKAVENTDWKSVGEKIKDFLVNIDWSGIVGKLTEAIGAAFGGFASMIWGIIEEAWNDVVQWWKDTAYEDGKFTLQGLLDGIVDKLKDIGGWIDEHIFQPFVNGFKDAFGIHSPSKVMEEMGTYLMEGLLGGLNGLVEDVKGVFDSIGGKINETWDNVKTWTGKKWESIKTTAGEAWDWLTGKSKEDFPAIEKSATDAFGKTQEVTDKTWKDSGNSVTESLNMMKGETSEKMRQIFKNVESYTKSIWNITANNWDAIGQKVSDVLNEMQQDVRRTTASIAGSFSSLSGQIENSMGGMYQAGRSAAQSFADGFQSVHIPTPHLYTSSWNTHYLNAEKSSWYQTPNFAVQWYANGGFPDTGEMFVARENGPELVGRMGRKNAVANNGQIVEGIRIGVYQAVSAALSKLENSQGNEKEITVVLEGDAKGLFRVIRTEGQNYQKSTGKPVFE